LLTDAAYGVTIAAGENAAFAFLFGAEVSLYLIWNGFTALGVWLGHMVMIPASLPLDFVVPLTFFVLLVSTVKTRIDVGVAFISTAAAVPCLTMQVGVSTVLIVALAGALAGARMENDHHATSGMDKP
jgi:predicted branched-subunit amino acid permease